MSNSLFIIGETGESIPISSELELTNKYNSYLKEYLLNPTDVLVYTNSNKLYTNKDKIEYFNNTKYFLYTKHFNKKIIKSFNNLIDKYNNPLSLGISINLNSLPEIEKDYNILEKNMKYLNNFTPEQIKLTYDKMWEFYENFILLYKNMKINSNICDKIKECYNNQFEGIRLLYKNIINKYEVIGNKKGDLDKYIDTLQEKSNKVILNFNESINELKKAELDPIHKNEKENYIYDIYYNQINDLYKLKDVLLNEGKSINENKTILYEKIDSCQTKIKSEKNSSMNELKHIWENLSNDYHLLINNVKKDLFKYFSELNDEFSMFKTKLNSIINIFNDNTMDSNINCINESIDYIRKLYEKYSNVNLFSRLQNNYHEPLNLCCIKMKNSMDKIPLKINELFTKFLCIKITIDNLLYEFELYNQRINKIENNYVLLESPKYYIKNYKNCLDEMKRRIIFNKKIENDLNRLYAIIKGENLFRKDFAKENEEFISDQYKYLLLSDIKLKIIFENNNEDSYLPKVNDNIIDGFLNDTILNNNDKQCNDTKLLKELTNKINDLENLIKCKDFELEKMISKIDLLNKKDINYQNEFIKINTIFDSLSENFFYQLSNKDKKINKKKVEIENLKKFISTYFCNNNNCKIYNCLMCKEIAKNNNVITTTEQYIKDLHDKLSNKIKTINRLEKSFQDLIFQTQCIKKYYFKHLNDTITKKNNEIQLTKVYYERKSMNYEEILSSMNQDSHNTKIDKIKIENNVTNIDYNSTNYIEEEAICYKKVYPGCKCLFIKNSEGIFVCINLTENYNNEHYKCKYILDFKYIKNELKNLIINNSLIVIGKVGDLNEVVIKNNDNEYNLPINSTIILVQLEEIYYAIGFPEKELVFKNYKF